MSTINREDETPMERQWSLIEKHYASAQPLIAEVIDVNKDGLIVEVEGIKGVVLHSHFAIIFDIAVDANAHSRDHVIEARLERMKGRKLQLRVIEVDRTRSHLVLSEYESVESRPLRGRREELLQRLQPGDVQKGIIRSLTNFGALVDLGGVYGLIHISELSHNQVKHPGEVVHVGQEVEVLVLDINDETMHLSMRHAQFREEALQELHTGDVRHGIVIALPTIGAFVDLGDMLGLIPASQLAGTYRTYVNQFKDLLHVGQGVLVKVLDIDKEKARASLSMIRPY